MKKSRFTGEQIIGFLKQVEAGAAVNSLRRKHGFSTPRSTSGAGAARGSAGDAGEDRDIRASGVRTNGSLAHGSAVSGGR
jgi:hypothetical protein